MDMDAELKQFQKKNAPSLLGSSLRDSSDNVPTMKSLTSVLYSPSTVYNGSEWTVEMDPVDAVRDCGGLVTDDYEEQLDDILDNSGHLKDNAIPDVVRMKGDESQRSPLTPSEINKFDKDGSKDDSQKISILGGDAEQFIVPASGATSNFKYPLRKKKGIKEVDNSKLELIEPDNMRSVDDIINYVDKGEFEKASTLVDDRVAQTICPPIKEVDLDDIKEPEIPDHAIETDSTFTAPAAMREGSESIFREIQESRSSSRRPPLSSQPSYNDRPNLARGDSMHSGLNGDLMISKTFDQSSNSLVSERKPRHDPSAPKISNSSSLNYLRSISRSRSRAAREPKSFSTDSRLESTDLRQNGALINDDEMSNAPDIEYAVNKALDFVEDTHSVQNGQKISESGDIVKHLQQGLAEVAEEEEASNRTYMNTTDLLDQLANSAKELMIGEEEEEGEEEEDEGGEEKKVDKEKTQAKDLVQATENQQNDEATERPLDLSEKTVDSGVKDEEASNEIELLTETMEEDVSKVDDMVENVASDSTDVGKASAQESTDSLEATEEPKEVGNEEVSEATVTQDAPCAESTKPDYEVKKQEGDNAKDEEIPLKTETTKQADEGEETEQQSLKKEISEENEANDGLTNSEKIPTSAGEGQESTSSIGQVETDTTKVANAESETKTAEVEDEDEDEDEEKSTSTESVKEDEGGIDLSGKKEEEPAKSEGDEINALIAAAAREQAMKASNSGLGKDGSVFIPKNDKMTFEDEPVYLYTSFAGGFHVSTRTNRLETILAANRIKYTYRDLGTDEDAKKVWRRYSAGKTLPGIVRGADDYIGNWEDIEEANEDYRVKSLIYETY